LLVVFLMLMLVALVAVLLTSGLTSGSSVAEGAGVLTTKKESFDVLFAAGDVKFNGR